MTSAFSWQNSVSLCPASFCFEDFTQRQGTIKDRNGRDLVDVEEIKKRWEEYTEELFKKDLNKLDNYDGVVSHPEPDILECEIRWTLGSTAVNKWRWR